MILEQTKEKLKTIGYCDFELKDFDENFLEIFEKIKYKSGDEQYQNHFTMIKFDYTGAGEVDGNIQYFGELSTFDEANQKKYELLDKYDERGIAQVWLTAPAFFIDSTTPTFTKDLEKCFYKILKYFYNETEEDVILGVQWTLYNNDCFLKDHNDGRGDEYQNTCAILIYLNDEWKEEWGGNLVLRNTKNTNEKKIAHKVVPNFGRVVIIDLKTFDTSHAVEKVIGDHNRFAIIAFATSRTKKESKNIQKIV
jgi:Rps23 Pro-64 3,4-dihydroxylase Tpa1-like proline 4-hydroxylase